MCTHRIVALHLLLWRKLLSGSLLCKLVHVVPAGLHGLLHGALQPSGQHDCVVQTLFKVVARDLAQATGAVTDTHAASRRKLQVCQATWLKSRGTQEKVGCLWLHVVMVSSAQPPVCPRTMISCSLSTPRTYCPAALCTRPANMAASFSVPNRALSPNTSPTGPAMASWALGYLLKICSAAMMIKSHPFWCVMRPRKLKMRASGSTVKPLTVCHACLASALAVNSV